MVTNREVLNNQDITDVLITLGRTMRAGHRCVINILTNSTDALYRIERKCTGNCEKCINDWLDEPAVVLPMIKEEK